MNKKIYIYIAYIFAISFLLFSIVYMIGDINKEKEIVTVNKEINTLVKKQNYTTKNLYKDENNIKIDINLPYTNSKNFNEKIEIIKNNYLKLLEVGVNTDTKYSLIISYDVFEYTEDILSFKINTSIFLGGAHPNSYIDTIVYDFNKDKEIFLEEILDNTLEEISNLCKEKIIKENLLKDYYIESMLKDGLKPINKNFKRFAIEKNCIIFFFEKYQIAPYAAGEFSITLDKNMVKFNEKNL